MGLLLRPDAYYGPTPEGIYFLTYQGTFHLPGRTMYELITRLAPYLDGRHDLDQLTADLSAERRGTVRDLLTHLMGLGVIRDVRQPDTFDAHRPEVEFLGYHRQDPLAAFRAYEDHRTLVLGTGRLPNAVAAAATRSGIRDVHIAAGSEDPDRMRPLLQGIDLVFHTAEPSTLERAHLVDRLCAETGIRVAQAVQLDNQVWLGPMGQVPSNGHTWTAGFSRWVARHPRTAQYAAADLTPSGAAAVAAQVVQGTFLTITEVAEHPQNQMVSFDPETLESRRHRFLPHPFTLAVTPDRPTIATDGPRIAEDIFSLRAVACTGDQVGVIGEPTERSFDQVPLRVCEIEVSDPVGLLGFRPNALSVTGVGLDFATARYRAAMRALAVYGSLMVDPRRLLTSGGKARDPKETLRELRTGQTTAFVWGYGCIDGKPVLIDARAAFSALRPDGTIDYRPPAGVSAGYSLREAVTAGLIAHCHQLTLGEAVTTTTPFPRVDPAEVSMDAEGDRYLRMLTAVGELLTFYDITGSLGVPAVMSYLGTAPAGCASGLSLSSALTQTLEQTVLAYQAKVNGQPRLAPPAVSQLPESARGTMRSTEHEGVTLDVASLDKKLRGQGHVPLVVPLDHDSEVHAIMPHIVHVVLDGR